jgi:hypothetical protein
MNDDVKTLITRDWPEKASDRFSFSEILAELKQIRFKILHGVQLDVVDKYLLDIRLQHNQPKSK